MSGIFGQILQGVLSGGGQGQGTPIAGILQQILAMRDGDQSGVAAIVSRFEAVGLAQHAQSWVGTGQNVPVTGDQIGSAFSPQQIEGWAQQAGTTPEAMRDVLAQALPHVVDHLTPSGQVPPQTPDLSDMLGRLLGGAGAARQP